MKVSELLPIGSVIWLRDAKRPLMIFGIKQSDMETDKEYDYTGVLYPEGSMGQESQFLFQHEDIEIVVFRGYEDENREAFIKSLEEFFEQREKEKEEE